MGGPGDALSSFERALTEPGLTLVTGPNGSGKSTAARALGARVAGSWVLSAESQQAFYEAQLAADESNFRQGVDTSSTVGELLAAPGRGHPLLAALRLEPLWERHYRQLSTGEARKVLLLQAVLRAPSLLILDDPFDGLDREARAELAQAIVHVAAHLPVLVVGAFGARELPFAAESVREVAVIAERRLTFRGTPQAFLARAPEGTRTPSAPAGGPRKLVRAPRRERAARAAGRRSRQATGSRSSSRGSTSASWPDSTRSSRGRMGPANRRCSR